MKAITNALDGVHPMIGYTIMLKPNAPVMRVAKRKIFSWKREHVIERAYYHGNGVWFFNYIVVNKRGCTSMPCEVHEEFVQQKTPNIDSIDAHQVLGDELYELCYESGSEEVFQAAVSARMGHTDFSPITPATVLFGMKLYDHETDAVRLLAMEIAAGFGIAGAEDALNAEKIETE